MWHLLGAPAGSWLRSGAAGTGGIRDAGSLGLLWKVDPVSWCRTQGAQQEEQGLTSSGHQWDENKPGTEICSVEIVNSLEGL